MMKDKYKTLITACWVVLGVCFLIKLLGGNFFEIMCNNEVIIKVCDFIDKTFLFYVFNFILFYVGCYYYYKAILKVDKFSGKLKYLHLVLIFVYIIKILINIFLKSDFGVLIGIICDTLFMILPIVFIDKNLWKRALLGYGLVMLFQIVSMLIKNLGASFATTSLLINSIYSIDYYIMIILYYLYSVKNKETKGAK